MAARSIAAATSYLAAGREIGWTGSQVGFATPAGFTRAFREHTGMTPTDYARANRRPTPPREDETLAQGVALLSEEGARSGSIVASITSGAGQLEPAGSMWVDTTVRG